MTDDDAGWFETLSSETVYEGFSTVRRDEVRMPDGSTAVREYVEHDDAVGVVPIMEDGSVLLVKQYRHPLGRYLLEIPAGKLDRDGEPPEEAARRELVEEVGYRAGRLDELLHFENSAGWTTESTTLYLATELSEAPAPPGFEPEDEEADMEVVRIPFEDAVELARTGSLTDAKTVLGLLLAADRRP